MRPLRSPGTTNLAPCSICSSLFLASVGDGFPVPQNFSFFAACPYIQTTFRHTVGNGGPSAAGFDRSAFRIIATFPNIQTVFLFIFIFPAFLMPHGVPPGHRRGIGAGNAGNYVPHITPERKRRTAAHAPLSEHSAWPPFSMAIYNSAGRYLLLVTCRFPNPPLGKHNLHRFGLRPNRCRKGISPIAMGDQRLCLWTLPALWKKGWTPNLLSLRRAASANYRA